MNNRHGGSNTCKGSGKGTIGAHCEVMTASSIMDISGSWCNMFGKEQLKAMLKDVQYNPKSNFNLFSIEKAIKKGWKLCGDQEGLVLMKDSVKLVFNVKFTTENCVIFCSYLWREHKISAILASTSVTMSI